MSVGQCRKNALEEAARECQNTFLRGSNERSSAADRAHRSMKRMLRLGLALAMLVFAGCAIAAEPQRVLFLYSFGRNFQPWDTFADYLRTDLARQSQRPLDFYEASVQAARFSDSNEDAPFVNYLRALFSGRQPDLIVAIGGPAVRFMQANAPHLFPSTPSILAGFDARILQGSDPPQNSAVVAVSIDIQAIIKNILQVLPETKTVAVAIGDSPLEKYWLEEIRREWRPFANGLQFIYFNEVSTDEMSRRSSELPAHSAIVFADVNVDALGVPHDQDRVLASLLAVANAPIFGLYDYQLGSGIVGGPLLPVRGLSRETAAVGVRLLQGEPASNIKTSPFSFGTPEFDSREITRWGIRKTDLPPGSTVSFREPSLLQRYKWPVASAVSFVTFLVLVIAVLLANRARLRRAHSELRASEQHMSLAATAANLRFWVWEIERDEVWSTKVDWIPRAWSPSRPVKFQQLVEDVYPDDRDSMRDAIRIALEAKGEYRAEYRVLLEDLTTRWIAGRGRAEFDHSGKPIRLRAVSIDVTERRRAEEEAYNLSGQLINAQEDERARLARALHDDVTQRLALLAIDAGRKGERLNEATGREALRFMRDSLVKISKDVHDLSYALHPAILEDLGLIEALRAECDRFASLGPVLVNLSTREIPHETLRSTTLCLFRVAQEALRNVALHSHAKTVEVTLGMFEGGLQLCVRDDGVGFDPSSQRKKPSLGHASMRQRVNLLDGRLDIESAHGRGTTILAWVPLEEAQIDETAGATG
jgi:signal transduction histidine kinase